MKFYVRILLLLALSVLAPCVAVSLITNHITFTQYQAVASHSQIDRLQAANSTNALVIENMEQSALRFSLEPVVQSLGDLTQLNFAPGNTGRLASLTRTQRMLDVLVATNVLLDSAYLYIDGSDYLISSRDSVIGLDLLADQDWAPKYRELRENHNAHRMLPAHPISTRYRATSTASDYSRSCLTYVYPITPFTSTFQGALVFNIRQDKLLELYLGNSMDSSIAIFDDTGNWLTGVEELDYPSILGETGWQAVFGGDAGDAGYLFSGVGVERIQCTYSRSADGRYVFLALQDMSVLMEKTTSYQIVFVVFLLLFLPFVALVVVAVSRRLYSPIGKLVKELNTGGRLDLSGEKDTLSAVSRAVNELLREDSRLFSDRRREKLRDATVLRILAGDKGEDDEDIRAILPYSRTVCAVCTPDAPVSQRRQDPNSDSRIRLLVRLLEEALAGDALRPTATRYDESTVVLLLSTDESVGDLEEILRDGLTRLRPELEAVMGDTVTFAVGSLGEALSGVRQCFEQAKNMVQYRFIFGLGAILFHDRIYTRAGHYSAEERLGYLRHCLDSGKKEAALQGITQLIGDIQSTPDISYICVSQVLNQLVTVLTQYTIDHDIRLEELLESSTPIFRQLWQNRTLDEACAWFHRVFAAAMDYQNVGSSPSGEYIGKILDYVRQNYCGDITIDSIAAHIGISYSYLRKLFKEATGRNLADYIGELRIQKAKQLLTETDYTVKAIAQLCGFNHERSFSRAFAQSEGMTPGKYKGLHTLGR